MESEPVFGQWHIRMSEDQKRRMRQKIIRGGKLADRIRKTAKKHHDEQEIPDAEKHMTDKLEETYSGTTSSSEKQTEQVPEKEKKSFRKKILAFLKRLFLP